MRTGRKGTLEAVGEKMRQREAGGTAVVMPAYSSTHRSTAPALLKCISRSRQDISFDGMIAIVLCQRYDPILTSLEGNVVFKTFSQ